jgi:hypothetical protein
VRIAEKFKADNVRHDPVRPLRCAVLTTVQEAELKEEEKGEALYFDDENIPDEEDEQVDEDDEPKLSKKARKARNKLSVAELKVRSPRIHHIRVLTAGRPLSSAPRPLNGRTPLLKTPASSFT